MVEFLDVIDLGLIIVVGKNEIEGNFGFALDVFAESFFVF
jgi:hypothetical protein